MRSAPNCEESGFRDAGDPHHICGVSPGPDNKLLDVPTGSGLQLHQSAINKHGDLVIGEDDLIVVPFLGSVWRGTFVACVSTPIASINVEPFVAGLAWVHRHLTRFHGLLEHGRTATAYMKKQLASFLPGHIQK